MSRDATRAAIRAVGGSLWNSDDKTDWFTLPNPEGRKRDPLNPEPGPRLPDKLGFFDIRDTLAFQTLYCHEREGGLVVYYDRPQAPAAQPGPSSAALLMLPRKPAA